MDDGDDRMEDTIEGEDDDGDATVESDTIDTQGSDTATVADSELKVSRLTKYFLKIEDLEIDFLLYYKYIPLYIYLIKSLYYNVNYTSP